VDDDTDRALVVRFRAGDREAFTELVVRYQRPIFNAAFWVLRNFDDANDVAQIVFLKVAERLDDYDPRYKFFSWIYRIAVNESLNLLRQNRHSEALDEDIDIPDSDDANPEWRVAEAEVAKRLHAALLTMSADHRIVVTLRHFSECSYQQIGEILDLDEKTVKSRLFEARQRLRSLLMDLRSE
jgi:RNA polymerase sigma-70 factor, ECF subfamily